MTESEFEVWKFELPIQDTVVLENIPEGFQPLHVGEQGGKLMLWAKIDPGDEREYRQFYVRGTGDRLGEASRPPNDYVGTVQMKNGLVWHVFC